MQIITILLLLIIIALLIHINSKILPRDYVQEALKRDEIRRTHDDE